MSSSEVQQYFDFILPLVRNAGKTILEAKIIDIETKDEIYDLVTVYDRKVEDTLIKILKRQYPTHEFIGEEESSSKHSISELSNKPTWIIDPIDGTANFVRKMPITGISIGLVIDKELQIGIVYNPFMDELYTAIKGQGAFLNGTKIFTSGLTNINSAVFSYELSLARNEKFRDMYLRRLAHLIGVIQGIRSFGCASLSLCYVASGIIDAYQCDGLYPWDAAAGVLIVREAGGYICDSNGGRFNLMQPNFLATATDTLASQFMIIERLADSKELPILNDENHPKN